MQGERTARVVISRSSAGRALSRRIVATDEAMRRHVRDVFEDRVDLLPDVMSITPDWDAVAARISSRYWGRHGDSLRLPDGTKIKVEHRTLDRVVVDLESRGHRTIRMDVEQLLELWNAEFGLSDVDDREGLMEPHPPGKPQYPFVPHRKGEPYWLTDGYGYGTPVNPVRWWWRRAVVAVRRVL